MTNIARTSKIAKVLAKPKKSSSGKGSIPPKDQIHLRVKAGNRCSICQKQLVFDDPASTITLKGEMCHIVGEKVKSARGKLENLPLNERNCYANLILLCRNHHEEIDKKPSLYSIAKLHGIKSNHEQWVEEQFSKKVLNPDELIYSSIINTLDEVLQLNNWNWFIANSVRQLVHLDFIEALDTVLLIEIKTNWPKKHPTLSKAIKNLLSGYDEYIKQYCKGAELGDRGEFFKPIMPKGHPGVNKDYIFESEMHDLWAQLNFNYLCKYVCLLNVFAQEVRKTINPLFYVVRGKFIVVDELGTHLGEWGTMMDPKINLVQQRIDELELQVNALKLKYKK